jgi:DNA topoisomerase I
LEASGEEITAKDFRTWAGTVLAFRALRALAPPDGQADARHEVATAMRATADQLGNTPAVARDSYVHPAVIDAYLDGSIGAALVHATEDAGQAAIAATDDETSALIELVGDALGADAGRVRHPDPRSCRCGGSGRSR